MNKNLTVNHNDLSWYEVNGEKIYNKAVAIELAKGDLSKINLKYMNDIWDTVDWTSEPIGSWEELCKQRALQIREKYPYVALWYTGGYDSDTILKTFIKNKILLDEIVIIDKSQLYYDIGTTFAKNQAKYVKENYYPNLNLNIIEKDFNSTINVYKTMKEDWFYNTIGSTSRFSKTNKFFYLSDSNILTKLVNFDNRADVMGHEKTKVFLHDNKWFTFFPDINLSNYVGCKSEDFYIHKDFLELNIKQTHNTIRWFESLPDISSELVHLIQGKDMTLNGPYTRYYAEWNINMGRYPLDKNDYASTNGLQKFNYSDDVDSKDSIKMLEYTKKHEQQIYKMFMNGLDRIKKINNQSANLGINPTIISKPYFVKDFKKNILTYQ